MKNAGLRMTVLGVVSVFVLLVAVSAYGQAPLKANISFAFVAAGKTLPAGQYEFVREANDEAIRVVSAASKGPAVVAMVMTRLAAGMHTTPQDAHIVFDKVGDQYILSEIWIPEIDGFMLHTTKEKHEHRIQNVPVR